MLSGSCRWEVGGFTAVLLAWHSLCFVHQHKDSHRGGTTEIEKVLIRNKGEQNQVQKREEGSVFPFFIPVRAVFGGLSRELRMNFPQTDSNWLGEVTGLLKCLW